MTSGVQELRHKWLAALHRVAKLKSYLVCSRHVRPPEFSLPYGHNTEFENDFEKKAVR